MNVEETKLQCLQISGGVLHAAKEMFEWIYPSPKAATTDVRASMNENNPFNSYQWANNNPLLDLKRNEPRDAHLYATAPDGSQWYWAGEPSNWVMKVKPTVADRVGFEPFDLTERS